MTILSNQVPETTYLFFLLIFTQVCAFMILIRFICEHFSYICGFLMGFEYRILYPIMKTCIGVFIFMSVCVCMCVCMVGFCLKRYL